MADQTVVLTGQQATLNQSTWGSQTNWGLGSWDTGGDVVGISAFNETGWGSDTYGTENWGESSLDVSLSGLSLTSALGTPTISTEINTGWGQDGWGVENWGQSGLTVELTAPNELTSSLPDTTWGAQGWGGSSDVGDVGVTWGGDFILNVADVMGVTGVSATSGIGSPTIILSPTITLTAPSGLTSNVGNITPGDMVIGLSGFNLTSNVGAISPADVVGLTGLEATTAVGVITIDSVLLVDVTGVGATSAVGSLITEVAYTLTAPATLTSGIGSITPADVMGLTGLEATTAVGNVAPLSYFDIDITGNQIVTIPLDAQTFYFLRNSTSGAYTVQFKYASGSGDTFTFSATDKSDALVFATANDGTNPDIYQIATGNVTLTGTQTLTNKTLTSPKIGTSILDTNGNELFLLTATGSAVNELTYANGATGDPATFTASGETNVGITLAAKGTGVIQLASSMNPTISTTGKTLVFGF